MTTTNGQAPFLSVAFYLGETEEYKKELSAIVEEFLHQRIKGMKNEKGVYVTQAFPKLRQCRSWKLRPFVAQQNGIIVPPHHRGRFTDT